jgi:hypothetical protein
MRHCIVLVLMLLSIQHYAQVIPASRQVNWSDALLSCQSAVPEIEVNVMDFGATGNGTTNDYTAVMNAINSLGGTLGYVYFPPGNYLISNTISLPDSAILKGASSDASVLQFNLGGAALDCIVMIGSPLTVFVQLDGGYTKDNEWILTDSAFLFNPGDYTEIVEENGSWDDVPISWASQSVGQIVQIDHRHNDTLFLESPLRITYESSLNPRIRKIDPRANAGIECLKIKRVDQSTSGANILMSLAANCFVRGVESDKSVSAHVDIFLSTRILIEGCYFHHSFLYDGASKHGYGVCLNSHAGECLVTNNIFRYLRHAMMVKTGANGNVFSYNYSREVHRSEPMTDYAGDICLHGHYPFANLFEGNIVQTIMVDMVNGPSGPYNTFFRNRAENYGIIFTAGPTPSNSQHIVGNDVTYNGFLFGPYSITGTDHIQHGNNVDGTIKPPGTGTLNDTSYYITSEPPFWSVSDSWPSLGIPNPLGTGTNPARARWFQGSGYTICPLYKEWTGTQGTSWNNPHNWDPYGVPEEPAEVNIPGSLPNYPQIQPGTVHRIKSLTLESNTTLNVLNGSMLIIK